MRCGGLGEPRILQGRAVHGAAARFVGEQERRPHLGGARRRALRRQRVDASSGTSNEKGGKW